MFETGSVGLVETQLFFYALSHFNLFIIILSCLIIILFTVCNHSIGTPIISIMMVQTIEQTHLTT